MESTSKTKSKEILSITIKPKDSLFFRKLLENASEILNETAIITINENAMKIFGLDKSKVVFYALTFDRKGFQEYTPKIGEGGNGEAHALIDFERIRKILRIVTENENLEVHLEFEPCTFVEGSTTMTRFCLTTLGTIKRKFDLEQENTFEAGGIESWDKILQALPKIRNNNSVQGIIDSKFFFTCIKDINLITTEAKIFAQEESLKFCGYNPKEKFTTEINASLNVLSSLVIKAETAQEITLGTEYLKKVEGALTEGDFQSEIIKPLFKEMTFGFTHQKPLCLLMERGSIKGEMIIAPRGEEDEEDDEEKKEKPKDRADTDQKDDWEFE